MGAVLSLSDRRVVLGMVAESLCDPRIVGVLADYLEDRGLCADGLRRNRVPFRDRVQFAGGFGGVGIRAMLAANQLARRHGQEIVAARVARGHNGMVEWDEWPVPIRDRREVLGIPGVGNEPGVAYSYSFRVWQGRVRSLAHARALVWAGLDGEEVPDDVQAGLDGLRVAMVEAIRGRAAGGALVAPAPGL